MARRAGVNCGPAGAGRDRHGEGAPRGGAFADCRSECKIPELDGGALRMWVGVYCVRRAPFLDDRPGSRYCRHRTLPERNTLRIFADAAELCLTPAWGLGSALWEISEMKIGMRCILA